jgi:hypothetical protein
VKTTRRTPGGPRAPQSMELKHAFLRKPFWIPADLGSQQVHAEVTTTKDKGSRVKCRWGPRVRT